VHARSRKRLDSELAIIDKRRRGPEMSATVMKQHRLNVKGRNLR
jgi:phosphoribosylpyrophosphate synthetase